MKGLFGRDFRWALYGEKPPAKNPDNEKGQTGHTQERCMRGVGGGFPRRVTGQWDCRQNSPG